MTPSSRRAAVSLAILVALVGADVAIRVVPPGPLRSVLRRISPEFQANLGGEIDVTNYYEGIIDEGGRSVQGGLLTNHWLFGVRNLMAAEARLKEACCGYPFKDPEYGKNRRLNSSAGPMSTNSLGMVDREYSEKKPAGTHRILLFGDSLGRALGVAQGTGFEPQLEDWLNGPAVNTTGRRVEILNLSTSARRVIRHLDSAIKKAPRLSADVFLLGLTRRDVPPRWATDIVDFQRQGVDPPYSFIRDLIQRSGVTRDDSRETAQAKFDSTYVPNMRQVLTEFKQVAAAQGIQTVIVLLLPTVEHLRTQSPKFDPLRSILKDLNYPVVDVVDAFRDVLDPMRLSIAPPDPHPNEEGHAILFARLKEQLTSRPEILNSLLGQAPKSVRKP